MLKILDDFYAYVVSQEIDKNAIYEERGDGFVVVSFPEEEKKIAYIILRLSSMKMKMMWKFMSENQ